MKLAVFQVVAATSLAALAGAIPTAPQYHKLLATRGDILPGYGPIIFLEDSAIADDGTYYLRVREPGSSSVNRGVILKDGEAFLDWDDPLSGGPTTIFQGGAMGTDARGGFVSVPRVESPMLVSPRGGLVRNRDLILAPRTVLGAPGATPNSTYDSIDAFHSVTPNEYLLSVKLEAPGAVPNDPRAVVRLVTDADGGIESEELIFRELDEFPGTNREIWAVPTRGHQLAGNSQGDVLAALALYPATGSTLWTLTLNGEILIDGGAPSSVPGHVWQMPYLGSVDINEAGDWVAHALLDDGTTQTSCIVKNGEVIAREGQVIPEFSPMGLNPFEPGDFLKLTDEGDVLWGGSWDSGGNLRYSAFFNDRLAIVPLTVIAGATILGLTSIQASADGSRQSVIALTSLPGGGGFTTSLIETRYDLAETFCTAVPNSTGRAANTAVMGSPIAAENDITLRATNVPEGAFVLFLTSPAQAFVAQPGGSVGNLCLGGAIGRYRGPGQILQANASGRSELAVDLNQHPSPTGSLTVGSGDTWLFQAWYRDTSQGQSISNFTDAALVTFE